MHEIDFVVWTGDSARHDNDEHHPRTVKQVLDLNRYLVHKFVEVFGKSDNIGNGDPTNDFIVPIVPTFGNNDVLPHNIFTPGPNRWTKTYANVWKAFIPEEQRHSFARGGWFFTEVIPNKLAVFSLNTMYFFDSNTAVDGCDRKSEPGYEHMEWLRIQLQFLRERGMKAILTGHVPPARTETKQGWDESCWRKYTLWLRQYRDVIVGSLYGHMNLDHFILQDTKKLKYKFAIDDTDGIGNGDAVDDTQIRTTTDDFTIQTKSTYLNELRKAWSKLPDPPEGLSYSHLNTRNEVDIDKKKKKSGKERKRKEFFHKIGGVWAERYSVSLTSPSVVPNFYPTLRVFEYNTTGLEHDHPAIRLEGRHKGGVEEKKKWADVPVKDVLSKLADSANDHDFRQALRDSDELDVKRRPSGLRKKKKKGRKPSFTVPKAPSKHSPPGPAYSPQTFTFLSYTQWFANLTTINNETAALPSSELSTDEGPEEEVRRMNQLHRTKTFEYEVEYDTRTDKTYKMSDLTIRSWLVLAHKMGKKTVSPNGYVDVEVDKMQENGGCQAAIPFQNSVTDTSEEQEVDGVESIAKHKKKKKEDKRVKNKIWKMFVRRAYVMTVPDEEVDHDFGS